MTINEARLRNTYTFAEAVAARQMHELQKRLGREAYEKLKARFAPRVKGTP